MSIARCPCSHQHLLWQAHRSHCKAVLIASPQAQHAEATDGVCSRQVGLQTAWQQEWQVASGLQVARVFFSL
jgi:hypothetical protein